MVETFEELKNRADAEQEKGGWGYLLVPVIFFAAFMLYPVVRLVLLSFQQYNAVEGTFHFVGLRNWADLFHYGPFFKIFLRSFGKALAPDKLVALVFIPFGIAALLQKIRPAEKQLFRALYFMLFIGAGVWISLMSVYNIMMRVLQFSDAPWRFHLLFHVTDLSSTLAAGIPFGILLFLSLRQPSDRLLDYNERTSLTGKKLGIGAMILILPSISYALQSFTAEALVSLSITDNFMERSFIRSFLHGRYGMGAVYSVLVLIPVITAGIIFWAVSRNRRLIIYLGDRGPERTDASEQSGSKTRAYSIISRIIFVFLLAAFGLFLFYSIRSLHEPFYGEKAPTFPVPGLMRSIGVTTFYLLFTVLIQVVISWMGGYALGTFRPKGRKIITFLLYAKVFILPGLIVLPFYLFALRAAMLNTLLPPIINFFGMPVGILLFKAYYEGVRLDRFRAGNNSYLEKHKNDSRLFALFTAVIFSLFHLNSLLVPLLTGATAKSRLTPAFIFRMLFTLQNRSIGDINTYLLLLYLPFIIVIIFCLMFLSVKMFSRMKIVFSVR